MPFKQNKNFLEFDLSFVHQKNLSLTKIMSPALR